MSQFQFRVSGAVVTALALSLAASLPAAAEGSSGSTTISGGGTYSGIAVSRIRGSGTYSGVAANRVRGSGTYVGGDGYNGFCWPEAYDGAPSTAEFINMPDAQRAVVGNIRFSSRTAPRSNAKIIDMENAEADMDCDNPGDICVIRP